LVAVVKIEPVLAEVCELLTDLTVKLGHARLAEMPSLITEAKEAARLIVRCSLASDPAGHLPPDEVAILRSELVRLGEALEAQIAGIINIRWKQLGGGTVSATRH
jgi:hypothetical protein